MGNEEKETRKTPVIQPGDRLVVDLDDPEAVADFLEFVAKLIRDKRSVTISVS